MAATRPDIELQPTVNVKTTKALQTGCVHIEQMKLARQQRFGKKCESLAGMQRSLFEEDVDADIAEISAHLDKLLPQTAYSALFDHGLASKFDQRFASIRSTGNLTFSTAF
ncbi:transposase [Escherichia coli]|nr:transposase [Escherichia coli]